MRAANTAVKFYAAVDRRDRETGDSIDDASGHFAIGCNEVPAIRTQWQSGLRAYEEVVCPGWQGVARRDHRSSLPVEGSYGFANAADLTWRHAGE